MEIFNSIINVFIANLLPFDQFNVSLQIKNTVKKMSLYWKKKHFWMVVYVSKIDILKCTQINWNETKSKLEWNRVGICIDTHP